MDSLSTGRQKAIELARSFGWRVTRISRSSWEFSRPDTGGLWDIFRISHQHLSVGAVMKRFEAYEPELADGVNTATTIEYNKFLKKHRPHFAWKGECDD